MSTRQNVDRKNRMSTFPFGLNPPLWTVFSARIAIVEAG
jgi:hypothetical protein